MAFFLAGCSNSLINNADETYLAALRDKGVSEEAAESINQQLDSALKLDKTTRELSEKFGAPSHSAHEVVRLNDLLHSALDRNPAIGSAAQSINRADAEHLNAIFGILPQVNAYFELARMNEDVIDSDNAVYQKGDATYPVTNMSAELYQPVFDLGKMFGLQYAVNAKSLAEVEYVASVRKAIYDVIDQYVTAAQSKRRAQSLRKRQNYLVRQISAQGTLSDTGLADDVKLASLRSERSTMASEESLENSKYEAALSNLSFMSGMTVYKIEPIRFPENILGVEQGLHPDDAVETGLRNNSEIMAAALRVAGSKIRRDKAWAEDFSPVVNAYAILDQEKREGSRFGGGSTTESATFGIRMTVPLFNPGGTGYSHLPAQGDTRSAALDYHAARRQVETDIRSSISRMLELRSAIRQARAAEAQSKRALQIEKARVRNGESVDLAVASRALRVNIVAEKRYYYEAEYLRAWVRLQYLIGHDLTRTQI